MKGFIIVTRNSLETHLVEDVLHDRRIRYEVWRTRDYREGRYIHFWCGSLVKFLVYKDLFVRSFGLFQAERRKKRVAAL